MVTVKTAISIEESLYEQTNILAKELRITRSKLFTLAIKDYLSRYQAQELVESINEAYQDGLDESETEMLQTMRHHQRKLLKTSW